MVAASLTSRCTGRRCADKEDRDGAHQVGGAVRNMLHGGSAGVSRCRRGSYSSFESAGDHQGTAAIMAPVIARAKRIKRMQANKGLIN